ncbi:hypothetical protein SALBM311S_05725 [Streptomyces alboniger]
MTSTDTDNAQKAPAKDRWDLPDVSGLVVGVLGGTGPQGKGLAYRLARAGQKVIIGSRAADRAEAAAGELGHGVEGADNADTARRSDIVIVAVPWDGHGKTLESLREELAGKLVVDCVNPLGFDKKGAYALKPEEGSAAEQAAALLPDSRVTAAFHHLSAVLLQNPEIDEIDTDVMVLGEVRADVEIVQALAGRIPGMRGVFAGRLRNAHQVESLVANLISVNRRYKAHAGLRVTDVSPIPPMITKITGQHDAEQGVRVLQRVQREIALRAHRDVAAVQGGARVRVLVQTERDDPAGRRRAGTRPRRGCAANPVQVAQPVTAVTASDPDEDGADPPVAVAGGGGGHRWRLLDSRARGGDCADRTGRTGRYVPESPTGSGPPVPFGHARRTHAADHPPSTSVPATPRKPRDRLRLHRRQWTPCAIASSAPPRHFAPTVRPSRSAGRGCVRC